MLSSIGLIPSVFPFPVVDSCGTPSFFMSLKMIFVWIGAGLVTVSLITLLMSSFSVAPLSSCAKWDITNSMINQTHLSITLMKTCNKQKSRLYLTWLQWRIMKFVNCCSRFSLTNLVIVAKFCSLLELHLWHDFFMFWLRLWCRYYFFSMFWFM